MKQILAAGILGLALAGCTQYDSEEPAVTAGPETGEQPTFGSSTDIMDEDGVTPTNIADRADIGLGGPPQEEYGNFEKQPLPGQESDAELAKQIRVALTTGSLGTTGAIAENQLTRIQVSAENGVVTLTGPVGSGQERQAIEDRVSGMKGVRGVRNQLVVARMGNNIPLNPRVPRNPDNTEAPYETE